MFYLASKNRTENDHLVGSRVNINITNQSLPQIKIERPNKSEEYISLNDNSNPNFFTYDNTSLPGNYLVYSGGKIIDDFAVNTDPLESETKYINDNEFKNYLDKINFKGHYIKINKHDNPADIVLQSRFGSELWKYFLFAALILAIIEMMVARDTKNEKLSRS